LNVVDSCGWIEHYSDGPNAGFFAAALEDAANLLVPSVCIYEVNKATLRRAGEDLALAVVSAMRLGRVVDLDSGLALAAVALSLEHDLPALDSFILATARAHGATLWTQDDHFEGLDGVKFVEAG
jgi:predicted nucleic acid-binding protein